MALSAKDCRIGTIVDHTFELRDDGKTVLRNPRRRGIIVEAKGQGSDTIGGDRPGHVSVQFKFESEAEAVKAAELNRVYPWDHPKARAALRRVRGESLTVGAEFEERAAPVRPHVEDAMQLTAKGKAGLVIDRREDKDLKEDQKD